MRIISRTVGPNPGKVKLKDAAKVFAQLYNSKLIIVDCGRKMTAKSVTNNYHAIFFYLILDMTSAQFFASLDQSQPAAELSPYLKSLWYDGKGDWENAHRIIQDIEDSTAAWIHGYLHRKEGDNGNAAYWYRKANKKISLLSLEEEWKEIVIALI